MKRIVVASDSFKGSLSSAEVAECVETGVHEVYPDCEVLKVIVADGGEGTVNAIVESLGGEKINICVHDPLGRIIEAQYGIVGDMAIIEMAAASGLTLLSVEEMNPLLTSTYGTGEMIVDAVKHGCTKIFIGLGGSATNDGGIGMLQALGFRFYGVSGNVIETCCGADLENIIAIDDSRVPDVIHSIEFIVACDVNTPFCGKEGAAYVFAPQKGADEQMVKRLDRGMKSFSEVINTKYGKDVRTVPGSGAAGGLGGAFYAFLNAELKKGIDMVLDAIKFDDLLMNTDLVITGEGKVDSQTPKGKVAAGVLAYAKKKGIPVIALGGKVEMCDSLKNMGFMGIFPITTDDVSLEIAMQPNVAKNNVRNKVINILTQMKH